MIAHARGMVLRLLELDFIRFSIVGGTGFIINLVILTGLNRVLGVPIFAAQLVGAEIALFSNFYLHNTWTYKKHRVKKTITSLLVQFHASTWPAIIGSAAMVGAGVRFLRLSSFVALVISSIIALGWNFAWSKYVIWRDMAPEKLREDVL